MDEVLMALIKDARNHVNSASFKDAAIAIHVNGLCDLVELQEQQKSAFIELYKRAEDISKIKSDSIAILKETVKTQEESIRLLKRHIGI